MDEVEQLVQPEAAVMPPLQIRNIHKGLNGTVECDVFDEPLQQWIPYTAVSTDPAPYAVAIFAYLAENNIVIADLEPSPNIRLRQESYERQWRDSELSRADVIVNKIEDYEIEADVRVWRQYRVALRKWPEQPGFPNPEARPKAPDADSPLE